MPFDANGNYTLPAIYKATAGQTIYATQHNTPLEDIRAALNVVLMRDGRAGWTGNQNANGYRLTGLANGADAQDAATVNQISDLLSQKGGNVTGDMDWGSKTSAGTVTHRFWSAGAPAEGAATPDATLTATGGTPGTANAGRVALKTGTFDLSGVQSTLLPDATLPQQPIVMGQLAALTPGRLLNIQRHFNPGTTPFKPTAGANFFRVWGQAGGASGGSAVWNGGNTISIAQAGSSGAWFMAEYSIDDLHDAITAGLPITVGEGGSRVSAGGQAAAQSGNNGGATSFGRFATAPGGIGGLGGGSISTGGWVSETGKTPGMPTGTGLVTAYCSPGVPAAPNMAVAANHSALFAGRGGASLFGPGATETTGNSSLTYDATAPGAGGSGVAVGQDGSTAAGGAGAAGGLIVEEWMV